MRAGHEQTADSWGYSQTRVDTADGADWVNWVYAWENPHPEKAVVALRCEPVSGLLVLAALSAGQATEQPLRWHTRRKALLTLPAGTAFEPTLDADGVLAQVRLDLGQVISALPRPAYPGDWEGSYNNALPRILEREILVEYSAHPDARFHLWDRRTVAVAEVEGGAGSAITPVAPATQRVTLRVVERGSGRAVPARLHVPGAAANTGAAGSPPHPQSGLVRGLFGGFSHRGIHQSTYINGETRIDLPLGRCTWKSPRGSRSRRSIAWCRWSLIRRRSSSRSTRCCPGRERGW